MKTDAHIPLLTKAPTRDHAIRHRDSAGRDRGRCTRTVHEMPGEYPYTRGIFPDGYLGRLWTMRQYSGFGTPEESNQRYNFLLEQGQTGLSVALDLPTQCGYDPIDSMARPEVGKVGVSLSNLREMEILFDGIDLAKISTSFTINGTAAIIYAMYLATADKAGVPRAKLTGTIQNDILKEFVARGTWIFPVRPVDAAGRGFDSLRESRKRRASTPSASRARTCATPDATRSRRWRSRSPTALAYVDELLGRGADLNGFAGRLSFFFYVHTDFFEEVCKFRAGAAHLGAADEGALRRDRSEELPVPLRRGMRRRVADRLAALQQHRRGSRSKRWRRCWAVRNRSSPPRLTRPFRFPPRRARRSRCARSRSSRMRAESRRPSMRSAAAITSNTSPTKWRKRSYA